MTATSEPAQLVAGDSWAWSRPDLAEAWLVADGWALRYHLAPEGGGASVMIDAVAFAVAVSPAASAGYAPGRWHWRAVVHDGTDRHTVGEGALVVLPDPAAATAADGRSHARKLLEAVRATLEGRATADHESYAIEGRSVTRIPFSELRKVEAQLVARVRAEDGGGFMQTARVAFRP